MLSRFMRHKIFLSRIMRLRVPLSHQRLISCRFMKARLTHVWPVIEDFPSYCDAIALTRKGRREGFITPSRLVKPNYLHGLLTKRLFSTA